MAKKQLTHAASYSNIRKSSIQQKAGESDRQYYRRLAKQANQRMVRLEDAAQAGAIAKAQRIAAKSSDISKEEIFINVTKYSYSKLQFNAEKLKGGLKRERGAGKEHRGYRFSETLLTDLSDKQVSRRIEMLKDFLESPTSTIQDVKQIYKKTAETFNKTYGTDFTWETMAKYYYSGLADKFKSNESIGSDGGLEVMAVLQKTPDKVIKNLQNIDAIVETVDDEVLQETVREALKENGKLIQELF